uniref:Transmembrane protein 94 (Trinotate prediction) n=1 Tax=Henneguya salminicola TaxID=69463 RepID=A0A6G3MFM6_HENSL
MKKASYIQANVVKNTRGECLLFSSGSSDYILDLCSHYWNGEDIVKISKKERGFLKHEISNLSHEGRAISFSSKHLFEFDKKDAELNFSYIKYTIRAEDCTKEKYDLNILNSISVTPLVNGLKASDIETSIFETNNQIYYGTILFSDNVINDCVDFIELLYTIGIRFIFFSSENQLSTRCFAKKLGIDCDWNTYISLKPQEVTATKSRR